MDLDSTESILDCFSGVSSTLIDMSVFVWIAYVCSEVSLLGCFCCSCDYVWIVEGLLKLCMLLSTQLLIFSITVSVVGKTAFG